MVAINRSQLTRSICLESFYDFVREFWSELIHEEPVWNWHIEFLCNELQRAAERVFKGLPKDSDYIINIPPGTTKSTICSIMFPAWALARNPAMRCICASHTETLCLDLSSKCRRIVKSERYKECFPEVVISDDQDTKGYWATTKGGFRFSATVGGKNPMGFHAHFIIVDDPIDPQKVFSEAELKAANDFMNITVPSRKVNATVTVTFLIMQRLHQDDPTGNRLANKSMGKVRHICLPAEVSEHVKPAYLKAKYKEGLLDPIRLPLVVLKEKKAMGEYGFSGQYRQHPVPIGGGMFKTNRIHLAPLPRKKFKRIVRYWDKAGTADDGAYTAGVKLGLYIAEDGLPQIWILHVYRGQWDSAERERNIVTTAKMDTRLVEIGVEQEPGSGGKESAENTVRRLMGYRVRVDKVRGDKVERADPFSVQVNEGNVYIPVNAEWARDFLDEMMFFPHSKYKDQIDAGSGAFALLTKPRVKVGAL